jgi:hypothetical protein
MRVIVVGLTLLALAACGDDDSTGSSTAPAVTNGQTSAPASSVVTTAAATKPSGPPSASDIAAVVCDDQAKRMGADAEAMTAESWMCSSGGEQARIDIYESADQMAAAQQTISDFYRQSGDKRGFDELPFVCGGRFSVGLDSNEQRDVVVAKLQTAGITASTCKS